MAVSRAAFFLAIVIPVNIAVVCWITGLRPRSRPLGVDAARGRGGRDRAGARPRGDGVLDGAAPIVGLIVAGACSTLAAGGTLFALEPRARGLALPVVRKMMRRETDTAPA